MKDALVQLNPNPNRINVTPARIVCTFLSILCMGGFIPEYSGSRKSTHCKMLNLI